MNSGIYPSLAAPTRTDLPSLLSQLCAAPGTPDARLFAAATPYPASVTTKEITFLCRKLQDAFARLKKRDALAVPDFLLQRWTTPCPSPFSPRRLEWVASRQALLAACEAADDAAGPASFSLAHADNLGAAAALVSLSAPYRIGIDFERSDRQIENRSIRFVANPRDDLGTTPALIQWCAREAALKGLAFTGKLHLRDVWLRRIAPLVFTTGTGSKDCGIVHVAQSEVWTASIATCGITPFLP